jgi:hypothetical protein
MEADMAMKKPEKGGKPKRITTQAPPGGKHTPGAKAARKKGIPEHKQAMKPTPAKMKAYAKGMREHVMNTGKYKKSYSTGGTAGGGSVGGAG